MLEKIVIRDFAVTRSVAIEPGPGLNVFTGETGAGKSLIVDALAFAFGGRRGRDVIASGADRATVEVKCADGGTRRTVERTIAASGRATGRIDGEPAAAEALLSLGARVIDIHGQSEQLAILKPAVQLAALDAFAGLAADRERVATLVRALRAVRRELRDLSGEGPERERLLGQLRFEADEIGSAGLEPGEDVALQAARSRLANVARLSEDVAAALAALDAAPLAEAVAAVAGLAGRDPAAADLAQLAETLDTVATDLRRGLRAYAETLEEDPERLQAIEERLDRIARLKRKYGATVDEVLAYGRSTAERLAALEGSGERVAALQTREATLRAEAGDLAEQLSRERRAAALKLAAGLADELTNLGMGRSSLAIGFACDDDELGLPADLPDYEVATGEMAAPCGERHPRAFTEAGVDRVEFLATFNPGEPPRPLGAIASGGETSRFLLALTAVLGAAAEPRTVIFDEVDEGVGGRAGALVGEALARLAGRHQVLCVTHLPQVAAYADRHFVVEKTAGEGSTWSRVRPIEGDVRIAELAAMLGGAGAAAGAAARELLASAERYRSSMATASISTR